MSQKYPVKINGNRIPKYVKYIKLQEVFISILKVRKNETANFKFISDEISKPLKKMKRATSTPFRQLPARHKLNFDEEKEDGDNDESICPIFDENTEDLMVNVQPLEYDEENDFERNTQY